MSLFDDYASWETPDGRLWARVSSEYEGRHGQSCVVLIDTRGRTYRYDRADVFRR